MSHMQELFERVGKNGVLLAKFNQIVEHAEQEGKEATEEKLIAFAKAEGFDISVTEMSEYFKKLPETGAGELSDAELDMVAGGKSTHGALNIVMSVVGLGFGCLFISAGAESLAHSCGDVFQ